MPVQSLPKVNEDFEHNDIYGDEGEDFVENRDGSYNEPDNEPDNEPYDDDNNNMQHDDDDDDRPWDQWHRQPRGNDNAGKCLDELLRLLNIYGF